MITMKPHICWEKDYPNSLNVVIGKVLWSSRGDWGTVAAIKGDRGSNYRKP